LDHPTLTGLAVFRDYTMVGKLTPEEMSTYMELRGLRKGAESFDVPLSGSQKATVHVFRRGAKYQLGTSQGKLTCRIRIELEADLMYLSPELSGEDPKVLLAIEQNAAQVVTKRGEALMQKLQHEYKADILAVGELVRAYKPKIWRGVTDWDEVFPKVQFQIETKVSIRRTGLGKD
jgi:spore germination protein KC